METNVNFFSLKGSFSGLFLYLQRPAVPWNEPTPNASEKCVRAGPRASSARVRRRQSLVVCSRPCDFKSAGVGVMPTEVQEASSTTKDSHPKAPVAAAMPSGEHSAPGHLGGSSLWLQADQLLLSSSWVHGVQLLPVPGAWADCKPGRVLCLALLLPSLPGGHGRG